MYRQMCKESMHASISKGTQTKSMVQRAMVCYKGTKRDPSASALPRLLGDSESQSNKECSCVWAPAVKALQIRDAPAHV